MLKQIKCDSEKLNAVAVDKNDPNEIFVCAFFFCSLVVGVISETTDRQTISRSIYHRHSNILFIIVIFFSLAFHSIFGFRNIFSLRSAAFTKLSFEMNIYVIENGSRTIEKAMGCIRQRVASTL